MPKPLENENKSFLHKGIMPLVIFVLLSLLLFSLSRTALCLWQGIPLGDHFFDIFVQGLRSDFSIICTTYAPVLLLLIIANLCGRGRALLIMASILSALVFTVHLLMELATPPFIEEYGVRPNHLFVDYLVYPKEVISTLIGGHLTALCLSIIAGIICFVLTLRLALRLYRGYIFISRPKTLLILCLGIVVCALGIRSTLGHRPLNPSMLSFGNDPLANDMPVNSSFKVFYALRHYGENDLNEGQLYAYDNEVNIIAAAKRLSARHDPAQLDPKCPLNQVITPKFSGSPKNVVVILEESMGADFVASLGGLPLTPNLERIAAKNWAFTGMYAAGHRSVRGIEAVTAGFPPSPLASQVKLDHVSPMATLMQIYKNLGYHTSFIYGGESHFDNMRTYFLYNGTDEVVEQKDYEDPSFTASWGVSDEDLFAKAHSKFQKWYAEGKPFCSVVFSSSFHDPFDIPQGKVDIGNIETKEPLRLAAVKYADYALGKFMDAAEKSAYYKDTIFVIIADHESRVQGIGGFPFDKFLIPAVIVSPEIGAKKDDRIVSQIDILPTLLSLSGIAGEFPLVGQDLTQDRIKERALMVYNELFGLRADNKLAVLMPDRKASFFKISGDRFVVKAGKSLSPLPFDEKLVKEGQALENLGLATYKGRWNDAFCIKGLKLN